MMFFLILSFLFYFNKICYQNSYIFNLKRGLNAYKKFTGNDERYIKNQTEMESQLHNFKKNLEKKQLLVILQNENISIYDKASLVRDNNNQQYNIKSGGLINDFD
jgi:hypothetical protein